MKDRCCVHSSGRLVVLACFLVACFILDAGVRICRGVVVDVEREKGRLLQKQHYYRSILSRRELVDEEWGYLFEVYGRPDPGNAELPMAMIDRVAREAGVRIDRLRPRDGGEVFDVELYGSWAQAVLFFYAMEKKSRAFSFLNLKIRPDGQALRMVLVMECGSVGGQAAAVSRESG